MGKQLVDDKMTLGKAILRIRRSHGWSQEKLEADSGVSQGTISALESGRQDETSFPNMRALAGALGYSLGRLLELGGLIDPEKDFDRAVDPVLDPLLDAIRSSPAVRNNFVTLQELGVPLDHVAQLAVRGVVGYTDGFIHAYEQALPYLEATRAQLAEMRQQTAELEAKRAEWQAELDRVNELIKKAGGVPV